MTSVAPVRSSRFPRRRPTPKNVLGRITGVASLLILLELASRGELIPSQWFPPITETYARLAELAITGDFWRNVGLTLQGWASGLAIAIVIGVPVGILIGLSPHLYRSLRLVIEFFRPIPSVALVPLAVLLWGTGMGTKVFLVGFAAFWPLLFQALYGVGEVDPVARDTATAYRLPRMARFWHITLPSAVPFIATGVRISSSIALILSVVAELVAGSPGIGREIALSQASLAIPTMYALIIAIGLLGWGLNTALLTLERRVLGWHTPYRPNGGRHT